MCGIAGWISYGRDLSGRGPVLRAMTDAMACRGPDAEGTWLSHRAAIGHRRLAVIDIEDGAQPMLANQDREVVLTFSGEVYNFKDLRRELEGHGHQFVTRFDAELDGEGLAELFAQLGTRTPGHGVYRGLREVRPGWTVRVTRKSLAAAPYWTLVARAHTDDLPTTISTVRELLDDIVERQLVADVPLCTLLSGGLDSSALSALAAGALERQGRGKLATFSVDFAGSEAGFRPDRLRPSHDEPFARAMADHAGTRHTTILLNAKDLVEAQHQPMWAHDLPSMGDMYVSIYLRCRALRQQSTVALSGESADEVFGGYPWHHDRGLLAAPGYPWAVRGSWAGLPREDIRVATRLEERAAQGYAGALAEVPELQGENGHDRRVRQVLHLGLTRWLPFLLDRKDRLSMAVGLEVRVPFCDHRLVEYVWNVPWPMKQTDDIEKGLLRRAVADLLPPEL